MQQPLLDSNVVSEYSHHLTITNSEFHQLCKLIYTHTGIYLSEHKRALLCSRLGKRLRHYRMTQYGEYYAYLVEHDHDGHELHEMINAITTNKTDFYREEHHFNFLSNFVFPAYKKEKKELREKRLLRIWSAGTSTGEEAYTLAITVMQAFPPPFCNGVKILATDIDTNVLGLAEAGIYTVEQADKIPQPLLHNYFFKGIGPNARYVKVKEELKSLIAFRHLNLQDRLWPMRNLFDVIFCRNVIIYFDKPTQEQIVSRFSKALRPNGYLMLGHSESLHGLDTGFSHVGHSIYQYCPKS